MRAQRLALAVTPALLAGFATLPAAAQSTGLEDMVGARAGQAEGELLRRGYRNVRGEQGDDRSYTYWWNAERRQCVSIATMDGRYDSITPTTAPDCRQAANGRPDPGYPRPSYPSGDRPIARPGGDAPVVGGRVVDVGLVCFGDGVRNGVASGTAWTWNPARERY